MTSTNDVSQRQPIELWGGLEATVNRVRDRYFSQMDQNGHSGRISDLDRFAALGIKALRYPVLWELIAPAGLASADWSWPDQRLPALRELGVQPIVGLVHHGSGPRHTSLVDDGFAEGLAEYAGAVAPAIPGSSTTPPSMNPAPPPASAPCTACGIRMRATTCPSCARCSTSARRGAVDARHPRGQSRRQTGADRRSGQDLQHAGTRRMGRLL
jgi:hypothetical protein